MANQRRPPSGVSSTVSALSAARLKDSLRPKSNQRSRHTDTDYSDLLLAAVRNRDVAQLEKCVKQGCDINVHLPGEDGFTSLHQACHCGSLEARSIDLHSGGMM